MPVHLGKPTRIAALELPLRRLFSGLVLIACASSAPGLQAQQGTAQIVFNPAACVTAETQCPIVVSWSSDNANIVQLWVSTDGGTAELFGCGALGQQAASWILRDHRYEFSMYRASSCAPDARQGKAIVRKQFG